jgi:hypothetical protein
VRISTNYGAPYCTAFSILLLSKFSSWTYNTVSGYGLDDRAIEVQSQAKADFSCSPSVQTATMRVLWGCFTFYNTASKMERWPELPRYSRSFSLRRQVEASCGAQEASSAGGKYAEIRK